MISMKKNFYDSGYVKIDGQRLPWHYVHTVEIVLHESTETFTAPAVLGKERMCLHDLKRKCRMKFRAAAMAEARAKFVAQLDAAQGLPESKKEKRLDLSQV